MNCGNSNGHHIISIPSKLHVQKWLYNRQVGACAIIAEIRGISFLVDDDFVRHKGVMDLVNLIEERIKLSNTKIIALQQQLDTSPSGINVKTIKDRIAKYGKNEIPQQKPVTFMKLILNGFDDRIIQILTVASIISLATGLYEYFVHHVEMAYVEGLAIVVTIIIVVFINAYQDFQKNKQFKFLSDQNQSNLKATVVRKHSVGDVENNRQSIVTLNIPVTDIVVGDVLHIQNGDIIAADGYLLTYSSLKVDESTLTGESEHVDKNEDDRYAISGSKVVDGMASMVVLATGINSQNGKLLMALRTPSEYTPLQAKLNDFGGKITKYGVSIAVIIFIISLAKYFYHGVNGQDPVVIFQSILHFLIGAITVIVVAVPEGLPMAVTLSLSFATIQMMKDNNLVRVLASCETMGNTTTICSDKTGTLTQNKMSVLRGYFDLREYKIEESDLSTIDTESLDLITKALNINSTASEVELENGKIEFIGSKTEIALLQMTQPYSNYVLDRKHSQIIKMIPFASDRKRMSIIVKLPNESLRLYCKGASEMVLSLCTTYFKDGSVELMTDAVLNKCNDKINKFANKGLRTIAFGFKSVDNDEMDESGLTLVGIVGIQDPVRKEVPDAVLKCQGAGIVVRMVTGDNIVTAKNIAQQCHIYNEESNHICMEGPEFRILQKDKLNSIVPQLRVLARSSPMDKQILVKTLKELGETVAVTGDGTNDGPALKEADVGFSMGIAGTEVAKEASDIILLDDNFASLVKAVIWGRSVFDSVRKFLQFQLTVNIVAVLVAVVSVVIDKDSEPILTAVQLLWVNLIMDTFAALALATDKPTEALLKRLPYRKSDPLISYDMWKMILGQAIYQFGISMFFMKFSHLILPTAENEAYIRSLVFNVFVLLQIFNLLNARRLSTKDFNIFKNIFENKFFVPLWIFMFAAQVSLIQVPFLHPIFKTISLGWYDWVLTLSAGFGGVLFGVIIKILPDIGRPSKL